MEMEHLKKIIGKWLSTKTRDDYLLATKVRMRVGPGVNDAGLSRKHILSGIENSLKNLQTDYVDLYQVHSWDTSTPLKETLSTLHDLLRSGKVRYVGISNFLPSQIQRAVDLASHMGFNFTTVQPQYHLLCRAVEWDLIPVCQTEGLGVLPWSPLAGGYLSGKFTSASVAEDAKESRIGWADKIGWTATAFSSLSGKDSNLKTLDVLHEVSKETGRSCAQVAIRWLLQKPGVTAPIIGARTIDQLKDNLGASTFTLTPEQVKKLDTASEVPIPYPYAQFWAQSREPTMFGKPPFQVVERRDLFL